MEMKENRADAGWGISKAMKEMGLDLEWEYGIEPLREGEHRPDGYYTTNAYTERGMRPVRKLPRPKTT